LPSGECRKEISFIHRLFCGENKAEGVVNSPHLKKPKKARVQAASIRLSTY
jgi:hypothetical protein